MLKEKKSYIKEKCGKIYYISPYMPDGEEYKKHISPAAQAKVGYIRSTIKKERLITVCVNCSLTVDNLIIKNKTVHDDRGECRILFSSSSKKRIFLPINGIIMLMSVFFFALFNIGRQDTVILYHSIYYDFIIRIFKRIKRFKLIYEVEEIYADVRNNGNGGKKEIQKCQTADAYIFPTELLNAKVNEKKKPYTVIYGAYSTPNTDRGLNLKSKVTVVYSGTLMRGKGAEEVIRCASYLNERYEIKIIGYGSEDEIQALREQIALMKSSCKVTFDGLKYGSEYYEYLSNCDIGLCIQPKENRFNDSSFPSKILSYLSSGLKIVATNIPAIKESELSSYICFVSSSKPQDVAIGIKIAEKMAAPESEVLFNLDQKAKREMGRLLKIIYIK